MRNEIVLPAGTRFVLTDEIPGMIAQALCQDLRPYDDGPVTIPVTIIRLRKMKKLTPDGALPVGFWGRVGSLEIEDLSEEDWGVLRDIWRGLPPLALPIDGADWTPYELAIERYAPDLEWQLTYDLESPWTEIMRRHRAAKQHAERLERAIESAELEQLDPVSQIPTTAYRHNGKVTVQALATYVAQFHVEVRVGKAMAPQVRSGQAAVASVMGEPETQCAEVPNTEPAVFPETKTAAIKKGDPDQDERAGAKDYIATEAEIIEAFKCRTDLFRDGHKLEWFNSAKRPGRGGRNPVKPMFDPFVIAENLPGTSYGRSLTREQAWGILERAFPDRYADVASYDPRKR